MSLALHSTLSFLFLFLCTHWVVCCNTQAGPSAAAPAAAFLHTFVCSSATKGVPH